MFNVGTYSEKERRGKEQRVSSPHPTKCAPAHQTRGYTPFFPSFLLAAFHPGKIIFSVDKPGPQFDGETS